MVITSHVARRTSHVARRTPRKFCVDFCPKLGVDAARREADADSERRVVIVRDADENVRRLNVETPGYGADHGYVRAMRVVKLLKEVCIGIAPAKVRRQPVNFCRDCGSGGLDHFRQPVTDGQATTVGEFPHVGG